MSILAELLLLSDRLELNNVLIPSVPLDYQLVAVTKRIIDEFRSSSILVTTTQHKCLVSRLTIGKHEKSLDIFTSPTPYIR